MVCGGVSSRSAPCWPSSAFRSPHRPTTSTSTASPAARQVRDEDLKAEIARVHAANYGVYGARKVWLTLNREGIEVARCTVERLMADLGLTGASGARPRRTTIADPAAARPADLVQRQFGPLAPNRLWVADFTYVSTWSGIGLRRLRRRRLRPADPRLAVASTMATSMVLDSIEQAIWTRQREGVVRSQRCCPSYGSRVAVHVDPVHRTARRSRDPALGRRRRQLL